VQIRLAGVIINFIWPLGVYHIITNTRNYINNIEMNALDGNP